MAIATIVGRYGIYERLIVPRLPRWQHVQLSWWALVCAPVVLPVVAFAVRRSSRWFAIGFTSAVAVNAVLLAGDMRMVARGYPVWHDTFSVDRYYFLSFSIRGVVIFLLLTLLSFVVALPSVFRAAARPD